MRLLVLAPHPFFTHRGTPIAVRALIETLAGAGHRLTVLTYPEGEPIDVPGCTLVRIARLPGVRRIPPSFSWKKLVCDAVMFVDCHALLREQRFDVIHAVEESAFIALAMKRLHDVPYVYDMDSSLAQQMIEKYPGLGGIGRGLSAAEGLAVRHSAGVLAVCPAVAAHARAHAPDHAIALLEDFSLLGPPGGSPDAPRLPLGEGPIVAYVGNLEGYQGVELLIDAFALAARERADARLVIVGGSEPALGTLRRRGEEQGIAPRVHWMGPRPVEELRHWLTLADVLVSPRLQGENTAMKVYSYMDSGRPILATRLSTHTQVLDDDLALLVEPRPQAMAAGLLRLLGDPELGQRLAANARERVQREYSVAAYRRKLLSFYERLEPELVHGRR
jgi:glycosyltransferase involved in cell wall biosynthesis